MAQKLGQAIPGLKMVREIMREWDEYVNAHAYRDEEGDLIWGEPLIRGLGETGLATLRYLARRGHFESARVLKETFLGLPELPLAVRIKDSTAGETDALLRQFLLEHMKFTPVVADAFLERFKRAALEEGPMTPPDMPALPAPAETVTGLRRKAKKRE